MRKYILIITVMLLGLNKSSAQYFFQAGAGVDLITVVDDFSDVESKGKSINLQIGRFVNERKMRSFSFAYNFGLRQLVDGGSYNINGVDVYTRREYTYSAMRFAYERKVNYANTEFDDPWNIYHIISYGVTLINLKSEFTNPAVKGVAKDDYSGSFFNVDIGVGLGFARKVSRDIYVYGDFKMYFPFFYPYSPISAQLGVRKLF